MICRSSGHAYKGNPNYSSLYVILGIYDVSELVYVNYDIYMVAEKKKSLLFVMHVYFFTKKNFKLYKQCKTINIVVFTKQQAEGVPFFFLSPIYPAYFSLSKKFRPVWIL